MTLYVCWGTLARVTVVFPNNAPPPSYPESVFSFAAEAHTPPILRIMPSIFPPGIGQNPKIGSPPSIAKLGKEGGPY